MDYVLSLSIPQLYYLQTQLASILKLENGVDDKSGKSGRSDPSLNQSTNDKDMNTFVMGETLKMLKKTTGRNSFTLQEMQNPSQVLKDYENNRNIQNK